MNTLTVEGATVINNTLNVTKNIGGGYVATFRNSNTTSGASGPQGICIQLDLVEPAEANHFITFKNNAGTQVGTIQGQTLAELHNCWFYKSDLKGKVLAGESVVSPEMMTKFVSVFRGKQTHAGAVVAESSSPALSQVPVVASGSANLDLLSAREREILALIAQGSSNKAIARKLDIAETTVKIHVQHIFRKLQLSSRVQAAVFAAGFGLA